MNRRKLAATALAAAAFLAVPGWSQDQGEDTPDPQAGQEAGSGGPAAEEESASAGESAAAPAEGEAAAADGGPTVVVDEEEESVLDDQTFEGEDDDFIPTEEIPVDEPIPFPTDI